jgi:hypothetical protein
MTIPSAFGAKGVGDKLTSGDANALNADIQMALDKRAGQTDALASIVSCGGAGRIVDSYAVGADADTTYLLSGANSLINASTVTALRNYTLSNTGALAGDRLMILNPTTFALNVRNGGGSIIAVLGPDTVTNSDSSWGDFIYTGSAWIVWRSAKHPAVVPATFTASGTWTCPRGIAWVLIIGWGGGGGGAGGAVGSTAVSPASAIGASGGGGANARTRLVAVTPGTTYTITIGSGGSGGIAGADGGSGGDTLFDTLGTFAGAAGGATGAVFATQYASRPGSPIRLVSNVANSRISVVNYSDLVVVSPGGGGAGMNGPNVSIASLAGTGSVEGFAGGNGALSGTINGNACGGGGGGGGGGGPAGIGGGGGVGGAGGNAGSAAAGSAGGAAALGGSGSGGGGGGSGGQCTFGGASVPGNGGAGGSGGSGQLVVVPFR